jgi:hypothetical protein
VLGAQEWFSMDAVAYTASATRRSGASLLAFTSLREGACVIDHRSRWSQRLASYEETGVVSDSQGSRRRGRGAARPRHENAEFKRVFR